MASDVQIANLALARISQDQIIALSDDSPSARFCNAFFDQAREECLQSNPWRFAIKTATLSQLTTTPLLEWAEEYQIPSDCLRVLSLNGCGPHDRSDYFEIQGKKLLTDEVTATIKYVWRVTDGSYYHPLFVSALSCLLASLIAKPLTGDEKAATSLLTEYARLTGPEARRVDAYLGHRRPALPAETSELVAARFRGGANDGGIYRTV